MTSITNLTPQQLRRAADMQERILNLQKELGQLLGSPVQVQSASKPSMARAAATANGPTEPKVRRRRRLSPAARARISAAATERWKKAKAAGKKRL